MQKLCSFISHCITIICFPLDTDDCLVDDTLCGPHGTCLNVEGSFECDCPIGFARTDDGKACKGMLLEKSSSQ